MPAWDQVWLRVQQQISAHAQQRRQQQQHVTFTVVQNRSAHVEQLRFTLDDKETGKQVSHARGLALQFLPVCQTRELQTKWRCCPFSLSGLVPRSSRVKDGRGQEYGTCRLAHGLLHACHAHSRLSAALFTR